MLDNPPFSILAKIIAFYLDRGIAFFLFAPSLTALSNRARVLECNHIVCDANITYANGAVVCAAFVTNFGGGLLLSDRAAAERAAAERTAAHKWELSARERAIVASLGEGGGVAADFANEPDAAELAGQMSLI